MKASWLVLERYALGECTADEVRGVEAALADDSDARAILAAIQGDARLLPPLPASVPRQGRQQGRQRMLAAGAVLLLAAVVLLVLALQERARYPVESPIKGGDVALELVALRDGLATSPAEVAVGDRLGLRLTCPPGPTRVDVVAFHGGEAAFPIDAATLDCGNLVLIPGAFSVDSAGPLVVCVAVGDVPPREVLAKGPAMASVCVEVPVRW